MPLANASPILAQGLLVLFRPETAPVTTEGAGRAWAAAYVNYVVAGGMPDAKAREESLASALETSFNPNLSGGGPALFLQALASFWPGISVPAQGGVVAAFTPSSSNVDSPQPGDATPEQSANGLAQIIHGLTLGGVKVSVPPGVIVPLL